MDIDALEPWERELVIKYPVTINDVQRFYYKTRNKMKTKRCCELVAEGYSVPFVFKLINLGLVKWEAN